MDSVAIARYLFFPNRTTQWVHRVKALVPRLPVSDESDAEHRGRDLNELTLESLERKPLSGFCQKTVLERRRCSRVFPSGAIVSW